MENLEIDYQIEQLKNELKLLDSNHPDYKVTYEKLEKMKLDRYNSLTPWDRVLIARKQSRPKASNYISSLFTDFIEFHGDELYEDDKAIRCGIAYLNDIAVTVIAQAKGRTINESIERRFGATNPEGFRKAKRLALQAEKFNRPIITIVDTAGAYPGKGAEERGQARAIAESLKTFGSLTVPVLVVVIGEGGSGGALALSIGNKILMLENAVYSILSPEGYASILYKDTSKVSESANKMKLTSFDLKEYGIVDKIIIEGPNGINDEYDRIIDEIKNYLYKELLKYKKMKKTDINNEKYQKFRKLGDIFL